MAHWNKHINRFILLCIILIAALPLYGQTITRKSLSTTGDLIIETSDQEYLNGHYQRAADLLDSALIVSPDDPILLYNRALTARILYGRTAGLPWLQEAVRLAPDKYFIAGEYGQALTMTGQLEEGEHWLQKAIDAEKEYYPGFVALGQNLRRQLRPNDAIDLLKPVIDNPLAHYEVWIELANAYDDIDDQPNRHKTLLLANKDFAYAPVLEALTRFHFEHGNTDSVVFYGRKYLEWYPRHKATEHPSVLEMCREVAPEKQFWPSTDYVETAFLTFDKDNATCCAPPVGKRFRYDVKYGFLGLGEMTIDSREGMWRGDSTYWIQAVVRSARGLPFVDIIDTFYVHIAKDFTHALWVEGRYWEKEKRALETHEFNYDAGHIDLREVQGDNHWTFRRLDLPPNAFDPISCVLLTPQVILGERTGNYTTLMSDGLKYTSINVYDKFDRLNEAGETWNTRYIDGQMEYHGIAGISGYYRGWFSHDCHFCMPIVAKFKIFLGSVTVRLEAIEESPVPPGRHWN